MKKIIILLPLIFLIYLCKFNKDVDSNTKKENFTSYDSLSIKKEKIDKILFDSSFDLKSIELFKNNNKYDLIFKDNSDDLIKKTSFNTSRQLKQLFFCENKNDREEKFIAIIDSTNVFFKAWSVKKLKIKEINNDFECFDYESESDYE